MKGRIFLWAEEAEAEALITARIIRAVTRIPAVLQDHPDPRVLHTDHPDLLTDLQVHPTGPHIRIIQAVPIIPGPEVMLHAADADARGFSA